MGKNAPELVEIAAFLEAAEEASARDHALACLLALNGLSIQAVCGATVAGLLDDPDQRLALHVALKLQRHPGMATTQPWRSGDSRAQSRTATA